MSISRISLAAVLVVFCLIIVTSTPAAVLAQDEPATASDNSEPTTTGHKPEPESTVPATVVTEQWVIQLAEGAAPEDVARQLGIIYLGPVGSLEGYYLFEARHLDPDEVAGRLEASAEVADAQLQLARERVLRLPSDPLFPNQWHLQNSGQSGGISGEDINVVPAWNAGYTGAGSVVAIVDDGLQHAHPDLTNNYQAAPSYDFWDFDPDPSPVTGADLHGTAAAGVAGADDDGAKCGVGVAYDTGLAGIRLVVGPTTDAQEASALGYQNGVIDIYNNSWGPLDTGTLLEGPRPLTAAAIANGVANGRGGKGNVYVWAGGNGQTNDDNVNYDGYANSRYTIAVAASDHDGVQNPNSEPGAALIVNAPSNGGISPASVTTTDLLGTQGYNGLPDLDCTNAFGDFGSTSSAAPLVSGVVALMLEANPNLTWRDVQQILIETADQNDPGDSDWTTNGAGHRVNHKYGFGRVNAAAAVSSAATWTNLPEVLSQTTGVLPVWQVIPDNNPVGVTDSVIITEDIVLEHVEVVFNASHPYRGDLKVILTSPDGTASVLSDTRADAGDYYSDWTFMSARNWGESALGTWTLQVIDGAALDLGTFQNWELRLYGQPPPPDFRLDLIPDSQSVCVGQNASYDLAVISLRGFSDPISLSASGEPAGSNVVIAPNPASPPITGTVSVNNTGGATAGDYTLAVVGSSTSGSYTTTANLTLLDMPTVAPTLLTPADGTLNQDTTPTFSWTPVAGATGYQLDVARDIGFSDIVLSTAVAGTSYSGLTLDADAIFYWRVRTVNSCGPGVNSAIAGFGTSNCRIYNSTDVPRRIPPVDTQGTTLSTITVPDHGVLNDVNVLNLAGTHSFVGDLDFYLDSPYSTQVHLIENQVCNTATFADFDLNMDDDASPGPWPCPPTGGGTYQPWGTLANFNDENQAGIWLLTVVDNYVADSGELLSWGLELCTAAKNADFSDIETSYGVAWHTGNGTTRIGNNWDVDDSFALGQDDLTDDGIVFVTPIVVGSPFVVSVDVTGGSGRIHGFFDWNDDGDFDDSGEYVFDQSVVNGVNVLNGTVPFSATPGIGFRYRFRLVNGTAPIQQSPVGGYATGEVTDGISPPPPPTAVQLSQVQALPATSRVAGLAAAVLLGSLLVAGLAQRGRRSQAVRVEERNQG